MIVFVLFILTCLLTSNNAMSIKNRSYSKNGRDENVFWRPDSLLDEGLELLKQHQLYSSGEGNIELEDYYPGLEFPVGHQPQYKLDLLKSPSDLKSNQCRCPRPCPCKAKNS
ncbi:uncharacterized protein LOC136040276 [Artemia franciscana]